MRNIKSVFKNQKGNTLLVTTMIVAAIGVMTLISLGISSRNLFATAQNFKDSQVAFSVVEGAVQETLQHVANDSDWPATNSFSDSYVFDEVNIERQITSSPSVRIYEISGSYHGVYRKIVITDDRVNNTLTFNEVIP